MSIRNLVIALGFSTAVSVSAAEPQYPIDPVSGLIMAPGWQVVNQQCNACHTSHIIPQNPGSRAVWKDTIDWMIDTQGLWDLSETWDPVLDYLSTYYNESGIDMRIFRRKPLSESQMPPMPSTNKEPL
ncbi:cytochrome C [Shewanella sp. Scap07]|uniref:cytochrome C n=1 Tax=Shewanella sp. Scap07 TaxID=2589987 RepID=UPI0015B7E451|nr:cytochrome C [Shewanella sp. Scap07]QLE84544.1 cytochrome C [Shewanella sp. Scap07]